MDPLACAAEGHKLMEGEVRQQLLEQDGVGDVLLEGVVERHAECAGRLDLAF